MIQISVNDFVNAAGSGALKRFLACGLSLSAWKSLRHLSASCEKEMKLFQAKREELVTKHGGKIQGGDRIEFTDKDEAKAFAKEWEDLMAIEIELSGDPIKIEDLQSGTLAASDHELLKPFFVAVT